MSKLPALSRLLRDPAVRRAVEDAMAATTVTQYGGTNGTFDGIEQYARLADRAQTFHVHGRGRRPTIAELAPWVACVPISCFGGDRADAHVVALVDALNADHA